MVPRHPCQYRVKTGHVRLAEETLHIIGFRSPVKAADTLRARTPWRPPFSIPVSRVLAEKGTGHEARDDYVVLLTCRTRGSQESVSGRHKLLEEGIVKRTRTSIWAVVGVFAPLAAGGVVLGSVLGTLARPVEAVQAPYCEEDECGPGGVCEHDGFTGMNCDQELAYCFSSICMP